MIQTFFYLILILVTVYILGYGVTNIFLPKKLRIYSFWLIPWIFILTTIVISVQCSLFGIPASKSAPILSFMYFVLSCYVYIKERPSLRISTEKFVISGIIVLNIIFNIIPILRREGIATTISLGNNDIIAYATAADYLVNHSLQESFHTKVLLPINNLFHDGYRWGPSTLTAFFLSIFRLQAYQLSYLIQAILLGFAIPLIYVFLRILYKPTFWGMILSTIMFGFNANLLYMLYHNFFGEVLFWGIELIFLILFLAYFGTEEEKIQKVNRFDFLIALTIATLYFSYHEPAVFMLTPLVLLLVWRLVLRINVIFYIKKLFTIGVLALSLSSISIFNAIIFDFAQSFGADTNQPIGWELFRSELPYANPYEAVGFYSIHSFPPLPNIVAVPLSLFTIFIIILSIIKLRQKPLIAFFTIIFLSFYYWTGIVHSNFFAYNRAVTYTLPFFVTIFTIGLLELIKKRHLQIGSVMILTGLIMFSALKLNKKLRSSYLAVDKALVSLNDVQIENISEPIYTEAFIDPKIPHWIQNWSGYFIYRGDVNRVPTKFNEISLLNRVPENSLVIIGKQSRWYYPPKKVLNDISWENEYYQLGRLCNSDECIKRADTDNYKLIIGSNNWEDALLLSGWSVREGDTRWSDSKEVTLRLTKKDIASKLLIEARTLKEPQTMTIFVNDKQSGKAQLDSEWGIHSFPIDNNETGLYKIRIQFSNLYIPAELNISTDSRSLSAAFKSFTLE